MSVEDIIMEELERFEEWFDMTDPNQKAAFLVPILAHRIHDQQIMIEYLKNRLDKFENIYKVSKKELSHG